MSRFDLVKEEVIKGLEEKGIDYLDVPFGLYINCDTVEEVLHNIEAFTEEQTLEQEKEVLERLREREQILSDLEKDPWLIDEGLELLDDEVYVNELCSNGEIEELRDFSIELIDKISVLENTIRDLAAIDNKIQKLEELESTPVDVYILDVSGKENYKIGIPTSKEMLSNKELDYQLIYAVAYASQQRKVQGESKAEDIYSWILHKDDINNMLKVLYNKHRNTFNKKFKGLIDAKILIPIKDDTGKDTGDYTYVYNQGSFITIDVEIALELLSHQFIKEPTYRFLSYIIRTCKMGEKKSLKYEYIWNKVGYSNLNNDDTKEYLEPLNLLGLVEIEMKDFRVGTIVNRKGYYTLRI